MIPPKLKAGDHVRIIAPSHSLSPAVTKEMRDRTVKEFEKLGLTVSFGKHVEELNDFDTSTIENRLEDLHEAYADPAVQAIVPARGGSSVTQLLKHIDYELVKNNPKILCGLSDITALSYALYAKTGVVNYYGPHFTMLATSRQTAYSFEYMQKVLMSDAVIDVRPSEHYNNALGESDLIVNEGYWAINEGKAEGECVGGNFLTTNFVLGSEFAPDFNDKILFLEENHLLDYKDVHNELQSILNQPGAGRIRGMLIGRFQRETGITRELLTKMIRSKEELKDVPVVGNLDFGHTAPMLTLPLGGSMQLDVQGPDRIKISITEH